MESHRHLTSMQMHIDKGLLSQNLAEVLTTVTASARYMREYPFPCFVHNTLSRLAQAFQGEVFGRKFEHSMNLIRLRIVTAVKECSGSLNLAFSSEDIMRCIMKVSHSNDSKARSLTLLFLASLAHLICEDKKFHNLVIESLDCAEEAELIAAIHAANELAKHSITFCPLIVSKIAEIFGQSQLDNQTKIKLFSVIANLRELKVVSSCLELGQAILNSSEQKIYPVVYSSLTQLTSRSEKDIPVQIALLLRELEKYLSSGNGPFVYCLLRNLCVLANHQQSWTQEHVLAICLNLSRIIRFGTKAILCMWLHCLELLSSTAHHAPLISDMKEWLSLLTDCDLVIRICSIKLAFNLINFGGDNGQLKELFISSALSTLNEFMVSDSDQKIARMKHYAHYRNEFFLLMSKYLRSPKCALGFSNSIVGIILRVPLCGAQKQIFELLAVVCDSYWADCRETISTFLFNSLKNISNLALVPPIVFTLLLSTTPASSFGVHDSITHQRLREFAARLLEHTEIDHWSLYQIARTALRFGHWKTIASPLLERVHTSCQNIETQSWLTALCRLAQAQPSSFAVDEISNSENHLQFACLALKSQASLDKDQPFDFAADYVICLQTTLRAVRSILTTLNVRLNGMAFFDGFWKKSLIQALSLIRNVFLEARQQWVALCSKSFDADIPTLLQMGLMIRMCLLVEQQLAFLCDPSKEQSLSEIRLEDLGEETKNLGQNAQLQNFLRLLNWARQELLSSKQVEDIAAQLNLLKEVLRTLMDFPQGLPRLFFQRIQRTRIKLIISPQPSDSKGVFRVSAMNLLPVVIEGIVDTNNAKPIESVCVILTLRRDNTAPTEKKQLVQLEGEKYFKAQFLLKIAHQKTTKISAKVWFTDSVTRKQWLDEKTDSAALTVELAE